MRDRFSNREDIVHLKLMAYRADSELIGANFFANEDYN